MDSTSSPFHRCPPTPSKLFIESVINERDNATVSLPRPIPPTSGGQKV